MLASFSGLAFTQTTSDPPGLAKWQNDMLALGRKWCNGQAYAFGWEQDVWYYDGTRVYYQIADYTQDPFWNQCALNVAHQYRDYVISNKGKIPGWRVFPRGLRMAWERTGDDSYKQAVILLATNSAYAYLAGGASDTLIRETAYVTEAYIEAERVGQPRNPKLQQAAGYLINDFERIFVLGGYQLHQSFWDGLAAEALIDYYELTQDPRVPPAIEMMLDGDWANAYNQTTHELAYNPDPPGPTCSVGCQQYDPDLTNLLVPAYAWYWNYSQNDVYRERGDVMFGHALDTDISYSGKIFSQNYRWSFDYVKWRTGVDPKYRADLNALAVPHTWMSIISRNSGKCLSIGNSPAATGAGDLADQWTCGGGTNQEFMFTPVNGGYRIIARNSNWSLGVRGGRSVITDGALIQQGYYNGLSDQIWIATYDAAGYYTLKLENSGKCVDVVGASKADGALVEQDSCSGGSNQEWTLFSPVPTNIISRNSGKCLSIGNSPQATGAGDLADQWTCAGGTNQQFMLTPVKGGYRIVAHNSNWSLGVRGGPASIADGDLIQQGYYNGLSDQIWIATYVSDGYYSLQLENSGKCLDVIGSSTADGALVQQYSCSGAANQQWTFSPAS
jgi:hypothetical protein